MFEDAPFTAVVVAPTFNNVRTLPQILDGLDRLGLPVIVVDDGCLDETAGILQAWSNTAANRIVLTHPVNRGKAAAMRTAFDHAYRNGFSHAVTIDTDGQLDPSEIPALLRVAQESPDAIVVGRRDATTRDYPLANRLARVGTNLLVRCETGVHIPDSQCGFRVYPLGPTRSLPCRTERYNFETEILTRAVWAGIPIESCPVQCKYELPEGRVSHFRPWLDSFACVRVHSRLLVESLVNGRRYRFDAETEAMPIWRRLLWWLSPLRAGRALRHDPAERARFAAALAIGVFIANLPLYGVQTLLALFTARRLRLNPLPVVLGSSLSTPPIGPLLITIAIGTGYWLRHGMLPDPSTFNPSIMGYRALVQSVLVEWAMGSIVCGTALAMLTYLFMRVLLRWLPGYAAQAAAPESAGPAPIRDRVIAESAA